MSDIGICKYCKHIDKDIIEKPCLHCAANLGEFEFDLSEHDKKIRADVLREVESAMYHQCFECDNDEDMQKWDGGNWFRYKLFENVIEQMKEHKDE